MSLRSVDEIFDLFADIPWFNSIGSVDDENVDHVADWDEARKYIYGQIVWTNFRNAISNRVSELWEGGFPGEEHYEVFPDIEKRLKKLTARKPFKVLDEQLSKEQKESSSPSATFRYHVTWDLRFIAYEHVCQDEVPPFFYLPVLLPHYQHGNFPCGWRGTMINSRWKGNGVNDLPKGRLRVL